MSQITKHGVVIVRLEDDPSVFEGLTFDYLAGPDADWVQRALMWQDTSCHALWLVPSVGEGRSIRLSAFSREVITRAPFYSLEERTAGLVRAANSMRSRREAH